MADLREALEAAFDTSDTEIPASSESTPPEPSSAPADAGSPIDATTTTPEPADGDGRVRDGLGRFVKVTQVDGKGQTPPATPAPTGEAPAQPQAPVQNTPKFEPPPRGVPPTLRSHWTGLTPEWRQHIAETHQRVQQAEEQYRPAVEFASRFMQTIEPYRHAIQAETGGDPIAAVHGLMDTAARLRFGTPGEKAATVAQIVKAYGVDIEALDGALVGLPQAPQQGITPDVIQQAVQQQLAPLFQQAQARRAEAEQRTAATVKGEIEKFASDPKHEFFEDVRDLMADAIEVAKRQGYDLSLADAYSRACLLHPEVSKVMLARQQGQSAASLTQAATRAKAAAVSVKGAAPVGSPEPTAPASVRDAIEAAIEAHSRV